jgi:hypothetical protein
MATMKLLPCKGRGTARRSRGMERCPPSESEPAGRFVSQTNLEHAGGMFHPIAPLRHAADAARHLPLQGRSFAA